MALEKEREEREDMISGTLSTDPLCNHDNVDDFFSLQGQNSRASYVKFFTLECLVKSCLNEGGYLPNERMTSVLTVIGYRKLRGKEGERIKREAGKHTECHLCSPRV